MTEAAAGFPSPCRIPAAPWRLAGTVRTRCTAKMRIALGQAAWRFSLDGPLAFLSHRRPLSSLRLYDLQASFGV